MLAFRKKFHHPREEFPYGSIAGRRESMKRKRFPFAADRAISTGVRYPPLATCIGSTL
jgi:hypothetical protein